MYTLPLTDLDFLKYWCQVFLGPSHFQGCTVFVTSAHCGKGYRAIRRGSIVAKVNGQAQLPGTEENVRF